jgi:CelD/BcsL family acetyltransferase involved in cellulose biosynthesis
MNYAPSRDQVDRGEAPGARASATGDIASLEAAWRRFETSAVCHVFQTYEFVSAWCSHVAPNEEIEPVFVTGTAEDGRLLYLLPLGIRRKLASRAVEWLGGDQADYHGGLFDAGHLKRLSADEAAFDAFLREVIEAIGGADVLHLTRMPADLRGVRNPFLRLTTYPNANGAHATRLAPDWETYYQSKRGKGWRRTDRSKERQLAEQGEIRFEIARDRTTLDAIVDALFEQKREGLARIGVDDMFAPQGIADFYRTLARGSLAPGSHVQISALYCGDAVAAVSYGLVFAGTYYYVLHSYGLDRFAAYSPGRQLMYRLMQWSFENDIAEFDFTIGDEAYKDNWCEVPLELFDAATAMTGAGVVTSGALRLFQGAKRQVKQNETLWSVAVGIRKALLNLRRG